MDKWKSNTVEDLDRLLADWVLMGFGISIPIGYLRPALAKVSGLKLLLAGRP